jgi:hypothetical protein
VFNEEKAQAICALVAEGKSLRSAAAENGITHRVFLNWCDARPELATQYARARATGTDAEFEELEALQAEEPRLTASGSVDPGWVAWKRLQVDTRKWALSKKAPKKYGEKIETTHEVGDSVTKIVRQIVNG